MQTSKTILLVGSGRLAKHLQLWNSTLSAPHQLLHWDRSLPIELLQQHFIRSQIVWLAITDSAIVKFYEENFAKISTLNHSVKFVHFSGALHHPLLIAAHPLMTFAAELYDKKIYGQIHFILTGCQNIQEALPNFNNSFSLLEADDKAFYHALCVIAGNFPQMLWSEVSAQFNQLNIPPEALSVYIQQVTNNFIQHNSNALTGPFARKDLSTLHQNLNSLKHSPLQKIYQSFLDVFF